MVPHPSETGSDVATAPGHSLRVGPPRRPFSSSRNPQDDDDDDDEEEDDVEVDVDSLERDIQEAVKSSHAGGASYAHLTQERRDLLRMLAQCKRNNDPVPFWGPSYDSESDLEEDARRQSWKQTKKTWGNQAPDKKGYGPTERGLSLEETLMLTMPSSLPPMGGTQGSPTHRHAKQVTTRIMTDSPSSRQSDRKESSSGGSGHTNPNQAAATTTRATADPGPAAPLKKVLSESSLPDKVNFWEQTVSSTRWFGMSTPKATNKTMTASPRGVAEFPPMPTNTPKMSVSGSSVSGGSSAAYSTSEPWHVHVANKWADWVGDACAVSPCHPRHLAEAFMHMTAHDPAVTPSPTVDTDSEAPRPSPAPPTTTEDNDHRNPQPIKTQEHDMVAAVKRAAHEELRSKPQSPALPAKKASTLKPQSPTTVSTGDRSTPPNSAEANSLKVMNDEEDEDKSSSQLSPAAARRMERHVRRMQKHPSQPENDRDSRDGKESRTFEEIEVFPEHHIQVRMPPTHSKSYRKSRAAAEAAAAEDAEDDEAKEKKKSKMLAPVQELEVKALEALELERSISELTMRSSYAATEHINNLAKIPDNNRRMAYYAVGKHHRQSGRGGNRRCYFSGKLILGGAPFYAGCVQQGLRTLVVFCLPSALGLPDRETLLKHTSTPPNSAQQARSSSNTSSSVLSRASNGVITSVSPALREHSRGAASTSGTTHKSKSEAGSHSLPPTPSVEGSPTLRHHLLSLNGGRVGGRLPSKGNTSGSSVADKSLNSKSGLSRLSSLDDLSLSIDGDLDPNWGLDRDLLLAVLPAASPELIHQMSELYPEQFETLPLHVRGASCWKLYVKFCFFSGLPIADGEMHYKVVDDIAEQVYGEEIALSHEVLEAAAGSSAELLTLPNRTVLRYLRKHYTQQCSKLDDRVFERVNWERVAPEV